jgi:hypothetical protein
MTPTDASARGRANRRQGHDAERDFARYLRYWWPEARRNVNTGWRSSTSDSPDRGDILGTPGITWQVKHVKQLDIARALAETTEQTIAAGNDLGVLVRRRDGHAHPGDWWAWLYAVDLARLICPDADVLTDPDAMWPALVAPVCLEVGHLVDLVMLTDLSPVPHPVPVPEPARLPVRPSTAVSAPRKDHP